MNTIENNDLFNQINASLKPEPKDVSGNLGQEDFLELMLAQLKNQDPTKPLDGQEYLGQLAQFSTVQGLQELHASVEQLGQQVQSSATLQAATLVQKTVVIDSNRGYLDAGEPLRAAVKLTENVKDLTVTVLDASGQPVRRLQLGDRAAGEVNFSWDGLDDRGVQRPAGSYRIEASGLVDGEASGFQTQVRATVDSVSLGQSGQGMSLNLSGLGPHNLDDVRQIL